MIGYFPHPYKDETLYSLTARYSNHIGIKSKFKIQDELIGLKRTTFEIENIKNLEYLAARVQHFSKDYTPEFFIKKHTTLPFYIPFIDKQSNNSRILLNKRWRGENDVPSKEQLFYCSTCLKEQFEKHGEGYWNRLFQIPGVLVCYKHQKVLNMLDRNIVRQDLNRLEIPDISLIFSSEISMNSKVLSELATVAKNIEYLLNHTLGDLISEGLYFKYLEHVKISGIAIPMSKMKDKLTKLLIYRFSEETLNLLNSNPLLNGWIDSLFYEGTLYKIHPLRHVLLMILFAGSVKNFIEVEPMFAPFGKGPWICMNPLSDHYLERVVRDIDITVHSGNRDFQADFICHCGYVYRLRIGERDPLKVKYFSNRVMRKGPIWEREFEKLLNSGASLQKISEKVHLSRPTIRKIIKEGPDPILNGLKKREHAVVGRRKQKSDEYKLIWQRLRRDNPDFTRFQLASMNRAAYSWLHLYEKEWLYANSPGSEVGTAIKKAESFSNLDKTYLEKIKTLNNNWSIFERNAGRLIKKTYSAFAKQIVGGMEIKYKKDKYPLTLGFLSEVIETTAAFQKRKLEKALNDHFKDKQVTKYKLTEKASVRKTLTPEAELYTEKIIKTHNQRLIDKKKH